MDDFGHLEEIVLKRIKENTDNTPTNNTDEQLKKIAPVIPVM